MQGATDMQSHFIAIVGRLEEYKNQKTQTTFITIIYPKFGVLPNT